MMYRHLRTNTLYRKTGDSFCVATQLHHVVYISMDTGEMFNRARHNFEENFVLVNDPQANIRPKDEARPIYINESQYTWHGHTINYEQLMELMGESKTRVLSVVWFSSDSRERRGELHKGKTIKVYPNMKFTAVST